MRTTDRVPFLPHDAENIRVLPYHEASFPPELLAVLWKKVIDDHPPKVVWTTGVPLTLNEFIRFFDGATRLLFLICHLPLEAASRPDFNFLDSIMGIAWLDEIFEHRAHGHFTFFRKWWGGWPQAGLRKCFDLIFHEPFPFTHIICRMNVHNQLGLRLVSQLPVRWVGEIPQWYRHGATLHSARIGYISKDNFYDEQ